MYLLQTFERQMKVCYSATSAKFSKIYRNESFDTTLHRVSTLYNRLSSESVLLRMQACNSSRNENLFPLTTARDAVRSRNAWLLRVPRTCLDRWRAWFRLLEAARELLGAQHAFLESHCLFTSSLEQLNFIVTNSKSVQNHSQLNTIQPYKTFG